MNGYYRDRKIHTHYLFSQLKGNTTATVEAAGHWIELIHALKPPSPSMKNAWPQLESTHGGVRLYETHGLKNQQHMVGSTSRITFISIWLLSNSHLHVTPCCVIGGASVLPLTISTKQSMDGTVGTNASQRGAQTQVGTSVWALITGCTHEAPERILFFFFQADRLQSRQICSPHDQMITPSAALTAHFLCISCRGSCMYAHLYTWFIMQQVISFPVYSAVWLKAFCYFLTLIISLKHVKIGSVNA